MMRTEIITIENDEDLEQARSLISSLMLSENEADLNRLHAQAIILREYEKKKWPSKPVTPAEILSYLMDQFDLTPEALIPTLGRGSNSRVSEILAGKKGFSLPQIKRLHSRYHIPADVLIGEPEKILG